MRTKDITQLAARVIDAKCRTRDSYSWLRNSHLLLEHGGGSEPVGRLVDLLTGSLVDLVSMEDVFWLMVLSHLGLIEEPIPYTYP